MPVSKASFGGGAGSAGGIGAKAPAKGGKGEMAAKYDAQCVEVYGDGAEWDGDEGCRCVCMYVCVCVCVYVCVGMGR